MLVWFTNESTCESFLIGSKMNSTNVMKLSPPPPPPPKKKTTIECTILYLFPQWRPLNSSEARGDLVLIKTLLLLLLFQLGVFAWQKQRGLYQRKVTSSLSAIQRPLPWAHNYKLIYYDRFFVIIFRYFFFAHKHKTLKLAGHIDFMKDIRKVIMRLLSTPGWHWYFNFQPTTKYITSNLRSATKVTLESSVNADWKSSLRVWYRSYLRVFNTIEGTMESSRRSDMVLQTSEYEKRYLALNQS